MTILGAAMTRSGIRPHFDDPGHESGRERPNPRIETDRIRGMYNVSKFEFRNIVDSGGSFPGFWFMGFHTLKSFLPLACGLPNARSGGDAGGMCLKNAQIDENTG